MFYWYSIWIPWAIAGDTSKINKSFWFGFYVSISKRLSVCKWMCACVRVHLKSFILSIYANSHGIIQIVLSSCIMYFVLHLLFLHRNCVWMRWIKSKSNENKQQPKKNRIKREKKKKKHCAHLLTCAERSTKLLCMRC